MIRVNLLPPEVIEKRKWDRYYPYLFVVAAVLVVVVVLLWSFLQFGVSTKSDELQTLEEETRDITAKSDKLQVFELQQQELTQRKDVVTKAMGGRILMGKLLEEVSLVLPSEVWLSRFDAKEYDVTLEGYTPKVEGFGSNEDLEDGYKSAAATLFRLGSLEQMYDVWLNEAQTDWFLAYQPDKVDKAIAPKIIQMKIGAKISGEPTQTGSPVK